MSRMLALRSPDPTALPADALEQFLALARVHSDGWGYAAVPLSGRMGTVTGMAKATERLRAVAAEPRTAALLYLRLASSGSPIARENLQPFRSGGLAFMHNGALVPRSRGLAALTASERRALRGTSDSEIYSALVERALASGRGSVRDRVSGAVAEIRSLYPTACLNAMMLVDGTLVVVASRGTAPTPLSALEAHGATLDSVESAAYNRLYITRTREGAHLVTTSGIDVEGWEEIADGEILVL